MLADIISFSPSDYQSIRRYAVKFCYQQEMGQERSFTEDVLMNFIHYFKIQIEHQEFLKELVSKVFKLMPQSDDFIEKYAKNWKLYRIAKVDLSILRVAITELMERKKTSPAIIISDALSIAEEFGSKDSVKFVNGILDSILKEMKKG